VIKVGPKVTRFTVGQRVSPIFHGTHLYGTVSVQNAPSQLGTFHDGALRQYAVFNEQACVAIPDHLSYREAATLPCAALTAWNALYGGSKILKPGETILTQGTGGVSIFALQFAKLGGAQVVATTSSAAKAERLRELGADHVINYNEDAAWGQTARGFSYRGQGVDFVVEIGGPGTLGQSKLAAAIESQLAIVGARAQQGRTSQESNGEELSNRRRVLAGSRQVQEEMNRLIQVSGLKPVIDEKVFTFAQVKEAYRYLQEARHFGKVVIDIV
jgi:NADPH:quinone reductase-like Zn-dependent oxidoreductase